MTWGFLCSVIAGPFPYLEVNLSDIKTETWQCSCTLYTLFSSFLSAFQSLFSLAISSTLQQSRAQSSYLHTPHTPHCRDHGGYSYIPIGSRKHAFNHRVYMLMEACERKNGAAICVFRKCEVSQSLLIYILI